MAYQDTISPKQVLSEDITVLRKALGSVSRFFSSFAQSVSRAAMARARYETIRTMQSMSDAQLAAANIKREDIVTHVMGDLYYS